MSLSLFSTFNECAPLHESTDKERTIDVIHREIKWQLREALSRLIENYATGQEVELRHDDAATTPQNISLDILWNRNSENGPDRKDILRQISFFLEDVLLHGEKQNVFVEYRNGKHLARLTYAPKDMLHTLSELRAHNFPHELQAICHLNIAYHLIDRAQDYVPAIKLH